MSQQGLSAFLAEFERYLHEFHAKFSRKGDSSEPRISEGGVLWHRQAEGALLLDPSEATSHAEMLASACAALSPEGDLSESTIQSAMQDAIYSVVDYA